MQYLAPDFADEAVAATFSTLSVHSFQLPLGQLSDIQSVLKIWHEDFLNDDIWVRLGLITPFAVRDNRFFDQWLPHLYLKLLG
jgi:hypothetical protein